MMEISERAKQCQKDMRYLMRGEEDNYGLYVLQQAIDEATAEKDKEINRLQDIEDKARKYCEAMTAHMERPIYMGTQYAMAVCWRDLVEALMGGEE